MLQNPNNNKVAIVFGATGQVGSYLCEHLLQLGYRTVVGPSRRVSVNTDERLIECFKYKNFYKAHADITDPFSLQRLYEKYFTDKDMEYEVYNLAAASHVHTSFIEPTTYAQITGVGHLNILEASRMYHDKDYNVHTYFSASSEMYGSQRDHDGFQSINTFMKPNSPYACAKLYAFNMNDVYRKSYGMWNCSGIMFNTESDRRGDDFVTRKITKWFADFGASKFHLTNKLELGNINAFRDWTDARDSVRAIQLINSAQLPRDYIIASGETHSVKNFLEECYMIIQDLCSVHCPFSLDELYEINSEFFRPNDVPYLKGQADEIRERLGWKPRTTFTQLVRNMLVSDYQKSIQNLSRDCVCV